MGSGRLRVYQVLFNRGFREDGNDYFVWNNKYKVYWSYWICVEFIFEFINLIVFMVVIGNENDGDFNGKLNDDVEYV